jgi:hypothetical protein
MKDSKRSKLEIISIFDLPLIFCVELEFERLKRSDSSGIRKLTSISFSIYMGKKKKRESMEIAAFKDKSRILPMLTFVHSDLNILSYF